MERQRQTVPIAGINRAENDLTVQDGCCETLHNLRYDAGAWRNVETFRPVAEITDFGGFTLLYKHPATADDLYIASDESGTIHEVCVSGGLDTGDYARGVGAAADFFVRECLGVYYRRSGAILRPLR